MKSLILGLLTIATLSSGGYAVANKTIDNQLGGTEAERRLTYVNDKSAILTAWEKRIDLLEGKAQVGAPPAEIGAQDGNKRKATSISDSVADLKKNFVAAKATLRKIRKAKTDDEWGQTTTDLEAKLREMDSTYKYAMAE